MGAFVPPTNVWNALALALNAPPSTPFDIVRSELSPTLTRWGNGYLLSVRPSGSYAKGTAIQGGTDVDLFCSISSTAPDTLESIQSSLFTALRLGGYSPVLQNVSVGLTVCGYKVDLTPGKKRSNAGNDHGLYSRKKGGWIQTNVDRHIQFVRSSGRLAEIRWFKQWRRAASIEWPSFHLELFCIRALRGARAGNLTSNIKIVLAAVVNELGCKLMDPANSNNNVDDSMTPAEKFALKRAAASKLQTLPFYGL